MLSVHTAARIKVVLLDAETQEEEASGTVETLIAHNWFDDDLCELVEVWARGGAVGELSVGTGASPMILRAVQPRP